MERSYEVRLHRELQTWLSSRSEPRLQAPVRHDLLELAVRGHTRRIKSIVGTNRGWLRSPLGGGSACHYYLWWLPPSTRDAPATQAPLIRVRAVRHHDQTDAPLDAGDLSTDYVPWSPHELPGLADAELPFTEGQLHLARGRAEVRILRGLPGTGKSSGLLFAAATFTDRPILYLTRNWRLAREATRFLRAYRLDPKQAHVLSFEELFDRLESMPPDRVRGAGRQEQFERTVTREFRSDLGSWKTHLPELYAEIYGHLLGRALPIPFRERPPSTGCLMEPPVYEGYRSPQMEPRLARQVVSVGQVLERSGHLATLFPSPVASGLALSHLSARHPAVDSFARVAAVLVDEVQDLTLKELHFLVRFWSHLASGETGKRPALLLAGDESQTVAPTDFTWGELADLINLEQGGRLDHELDLNLRSPSAIAAVVSRSWGLYSHLGKRERPRGVGHVPARPDESEGRVIHVSCRDDAELDHLTREVSCLPHGVVLWPGGALPAAITTTCKTSDAFLTAPAVKGLEFATVALLDAGRHLAAFEEAAGQADRTPASLGVRLMADRLRVCLSRATENLILVDLSPDDASRLAVERLAGGIAQEMGSAEFCAWLRATDHDPVEAIQLLADGAEVLLEDHPRLALGRARSALDECLRWGKEQPIFGELEERLRIVMGVSAALIALDESEPAAGADRAGLVLQSIESLRQAGLEGQARTVLAIYQTRFSGTTMEASLVGIQTILEQLQELHPALRVRALDAMVLWCHRSAQEPRPREEKFELDRVTAVLDELQTRVAPERPLILSSLARLREQFSVVPSVPRSHEEQLRLDWDHAMREGLKETYQKQYKKAERWYRTALRLARELIEPLGRQAFTMVRIGAMNLRRGLFAQVVRDIEQALPLLETAAGRFCEPALEARRDLVQAHLMLNHHERAEPVTRELLIGLEELYGPEHEEMVAPLWWLAQIVDRRGNMEEGLSCLSRAVRICDDQGTPIGVDYGDLLQDYAGLLRRSGRAEEAHAIVRSLLIEDPRNADRETALLEATIPQLIERLLFGEPADGPSIQLALEDREITRVNEALIDRLVSLTPTEIGSAVEASEAQSIVITRTSIQTPAARLARRPGRALWKLDGRSVARLIVQLTAKDPIQRELTCHVIGHAVLFIDKEPGATIPGSLIPLLADPVSDVRVAAANALGSHIRPAAEVVEALLKATSDPNAAVAMRAMLSLADVDQLAEIFAPRLLKLLESPDVNTRTLALRGLELYRRAARDALPAVLHVLDDADSGLRAMALHTAGSIGGPAAIVSAVERALEDPVAEVRQAACFVLADMGRTGEALLAKVESLLREDEDDGVQMEARQARTAILRILRSPEWLPEDADD